MLADGLRGLEHISLYRMLAGLALALRLQGGLRCLVHLYPAQKAVAVLVYRESRHPSRCRSRSVLYTARRYAVLVVSQESLPFVYRKALSGCTCRSLPFVYRKALSGTSLGAGTGRRPAQS